MSNRGLPSRSWPESHGWVVHGSYPHAPPHDVVVLTHRSPTDRGWITHSLVDGSFRCFVHGSPMAVTIWPLGRHGLPGRTRYGSSQWVAHLSGSPMTRWCSNNPWVAHGSTVIRWYLVAHGPPIGRPWVTHGPPIGRPWVTHGSPMVHQRLLAPAHRSPMRIPWASGHTRKSRVSMHTHPSNKKKCELFLR